MGIGYKGLLYAGKVMAAAAIEFMQHPELVEKARAEFEEHTKGKTYQSPIPDEVKPPVF
jgi:aminobenzoyl-glutamate utilization protein B